MISIRLSLCSKREMFQLPSGHSLQDRTKGQTPYLETMPVTSSRSLERGNKAMPTYKHCAPAGAGGGIVMSRKTFVNKLLLVCALLLLCGVGAGQTYAQQKPPVDVLEGLDPVMLAQGKETQGEMNITVTRGKFRYMFANAANKATFEQDPARYEIQLEGHCAPTGGNPDLHTVYQGRIYIFGSEECKQQFDAAPQSFFEPERKSGVAAARPAELKKGQALIEQ